MARLVDGQRLKQGKVENREDYGTRADTQRRGSHRDRGKARCAAHRANCVADVLEQGVKRGLPPDIAHALLYRVDTAHFQPDRADRGGPIDTGSDFLVYRGVEELAELGVQLLLDACASEPGTQPADDPPDPRHQSLPRDVARIRVMAVVCTFQSRVSRLRVWRPSGLSE